MFFEVVCELPVSAGAVVDFSRMRCVVIDVIRAYRKCFGIFNQDVDSVTFVLQYFAFAFHKCKVEVLIMSVGFGYATEVVNLFAEMLFAEFSYSAVDSIDIFPYKAVGAMFAEVYIAYAF